MSQPPSEDASDAPLPPDAHSGRAEARDRHRDENPLSRRKARRRTKKPNGRGARVRLRAPARPGRLRRARSWHGWGPLGKIVAALTGSATAFAAIGALYFTNQSLQATQLQVAQNGQQVDLAQQGQYTDRFGKAVEQLGSEKLDVRLGGIYALERLTADSRRDATTILEVLGAFARTHSTCSTTLARPPADVSAVLTVLSRRLTGGPGFRFPRADLTKMCLAAADLTTLTFDYLNLDGSDLRDSTLNSARLNDVSLFQADLRNADLRNTNWRLVRAAEARLDRAVLAGARLPLTSFTRAVLDHANLDTVDTRLFLQKIQDGAAVTVEDADSGCDFSNASLVDATLRNAALSSARFVNSVLTRTDFTGAHLARARFAGEARTTNEPRTGPQDTIAGALNDVRFTDADLTGADFHGLSLHTVDFTGANLRGANLRDTDLRGAIMTGAKLDGADLTGALR